jgi:hypothetical protein
MGSVLGKLTDLPMRSQVFGPIANKFSAAALEMRRRLNKILL